jgi:hypothetical protein
MEESPDEFMTRESEKNKKNIKKYLVILLLASILVCCLSLLAYRLIADIERKSCYPNIAIRLNIDPPYDWLHVQQVIDAKAQSLMNTSMTQAEVISALENIAPVTTLNEGKTSEEGYYQTAILKLCKISPENDIRFSIHYDQTGHFVSIFWLYDD